MTTRMEWMTTMAVLAATVVTGNVLAADGPAEHKGHGEYEAAQQTIVPQATCPVMGGKVNKALYVDHEGQRIYVCCKGCIAPLQKDFEKHAKKVGAAGQTVAKLQTTCPVMGGKINRNLYVDHDGKRIYVCCAGCIGPIKADPDKYVKKIEEDGMIVDLTPPPEQVGDQGDH